jgi:energy-coupling factor transport system permease protein
MTLTATSLSATELVRALMQNCGLSPRWGYALYAGLNCVPALRDDLETLKATRRIRLAGRRESLADSLSLPIYLLAGAIRRAERITISMTVRELECGEKRTYLVTCRWGARDAAYLCATAIIAITTLILSIQGGYFRYGLG